MIRDLSQYMMAFTVDYNTKAVDTYQVSLGFGCVVVVVCRGIASHTLLSRA